MRNIIKWLVLGTVGLAAGFVLVAQTMRSTGPEKTIVRKAGSTTTSNKKSSVDLTAPVLSGALAQQIDAEVKTANGSGTMLVVKDGQPILYQGYGLADKSTNQPNTVNSLYNIASIEKNMTALLVMQAVSAGKISLTDSVAKYLPNLPGASDATIQQLLNMTAGYKQTSKTEEKLNEAGYTNFALAHMTKDSGGWVYSAGNYVILVAILRQVNGIDFQQQFAAYFGQKLGIPYLDYEPFLNSPNKTVNYAENDTPYYDNPPIYNREIGTGSVEMTPAGFYKLLKLELGGKLLSQSDFQKMITLGPNETYAAGMYQDDPNTFWMHGTLLGYEPSIMTSRDGRNMVIWFSNHDQTSNHANMDLTKKIYGELGVAS